MKPSARRNRFPLFFLTVSFFIFLAFLYSEDLSCLLSGSILPPPLPKVAGSSISSPLLVFSADQIQNQDEREAGSYSESQLRQRLNLQRVPFSIGKTADGCNLFAGKWVKDEVFHPNYQEHECPYIQPQLTCKDHGRPDSEYQHWRWQPHGCSLPRFNATLMLETLRGKRMLYVGDSLNRGQYVSMICLLHGVIPEHAKSIETNGSLTVFTAKEYNATIEFYWAPFLLESNSDDAVVHRVPDRVVRANAIDRHARYWKGADIIVFNTYLWWMTGQDMNILRGSFENETKEIIPMKTEVAYKMALDNMVRWIENHMDPLTSRVFFTSMSPTHEKSKEWGTEKEGNCYNETTPITDPNYWGSSSRKNIMRLIGDVFSEMSVPITFLNITQLSLYRKDAHTAIYKKQWSPLTPEQLANPVSYADCVHWCLPGLQDTWNELLYAKLLYP